MLNQYKAITVLFTTLFVSTVFSQNYSFSKFNSSYSNLTNPTNLTQSMVWDDPEFYIEIPFSFEVNGVGYDSLAIGDLGTTVYFGYSSGSQMQTIYPTTIDVIDRGYDLGVSQSSINYLVDGSIGSRVLKIEWRNVGSYGEQGSGSFNNFINYQLWLHENGNVIEVRFGNSYVVDPNVFYEGETGAGVGILQNNPYTIHWLSGGAVSPQMTDSIAHLLGTPLSGQVFQFTPTAAAGVDEVVTDDVTLYPSICHDYLYLESTIEIDNVLFYSLSGIKVKEITGLLSNQIDISKLAKGVYLVVVETKQGRQISKKGN